MSTDSAYPHRRRNRLFWYSTFLLTTAPLLLYGIVFLHIQDGLLAKEDEKLPFTGHVISALENLDFVERLVLIMFMGRCSKQTRVPGHNWAVDVVKNVCMAVRSLISAVESFDHLLEWAVFCRNGIVIGKANDLSDLERKVFAQLLCEFHGGEGICTVAVCNELKVHWQLCKSPECHTHSEDAGANATVIRYLVTDNGTGGSVHDKPDVGFDPADFYVCLVRGEHISFFVGYWSANGLTQMAAVLHQLVTCW